MKGRELVTTLFIQAWWADLTGDKPQSQYILFTALATLMRGVPFAETHYAC